LFHAVLVTSNMICCRCLLRLFASIGGVGGLADATRCREATSTTVPLPRAAGSCKGNRPIASHAPSKAGERRPWEGGVRYSFDLLEESRARFLDKGGVPVVQQFQRAMWHALDEPRGGG
jgi:hypothetical protein